MSASTKVMRLGKICALCQRQSYSKTNAFCSFQARKISSEAVPAQNDEPKEKVLQSRPNLRPFPKEVQLDPLVSTGFESNMMKGRKHPGRFAGKTSQLPSNLEEAANVIVEKYSSNYKILKQKAEALKLFISTRVAPKERQEYRQRIEKIFSRLSEKELGKLNSQEIRLEELEEEELQILQEKLQKRAVEEAQRAGFTWKPLPIVNANNGLVYMVARLAQNYSVLLQIFNEMKIRDPFFVPGAVYNCGSGIGSVIWAANSVWYSDIFEYYCVDESGHMNTLARLLLQGGSEDQKMCIPGVYFRQFHSSDKTQYKLVVCAYTLLELTGKKERVELVTSLWNKTETYLVLVEVGNAAGYKVILEARDHILNLKNKTQRRQTGDVEGHVFAPCPHDSVCSKMQYHKNYCHFQSYYKPLHIGQGPRKEDKQREKFSYVVLKKGARLEADTWPRITYEVQKRNRHLHCHLCCPDGSLQHCIISKNSDKYSKYLYKCARGSQWGDKLPVTWPVTWSSKQVEESTESSASSSTENNNSLTQTDAIHYQTDLDSKYSEHNGSVEEKTRQSNGDYYHSGDFVQNIK